MKDLKKTSSIRRRNRFSVQEIRLIRKYCEKMVRSERISEEGIIDALTGTELLRKYNSVIEVSLTSYNTYTVM